MKKILLVFCVSFFIILNGCNLGVNASSEDTTEQTDPGTTDPGTTDPGTTDPGTTDPGTTDPGTTDPGTTDPGTTDPGTTDPETPFAADFTVPADQPLTISFDIGNKAAGTSYSVTSYELINSAGTVVEKISFEGMTLTELDGADTGYIGTGGKAFIVSSTFDTNEAAGKADDTARKAYTFSQGLVITDNWTGDSEYTVELVNNVLTINVTTPGTETYSIQGVVATGTIPAAEYEFKVDGAAMTADASVLVWKDGDFGTSNPALYPTE